MSEPFVFDPRCSLCKEPYGAVPCGQTVTLHCRPMACEAFTHCAVVLQYEFSNTTRELELSCSGPEWDRICYTLQFDVPEAPDLLWYYFRLWRDDGSGCFLDKTGYRSTPVTEAWQITVYRPSHTPEWFGRGVTYQIFPDRFCRTEIPDPTGLPGNRWVHQDWSETPAWAPESDGEIYNRDFFGGSLQGIVSKLEQLRDMGVSTLYLCPIFESASNHRYNTGNYKKIDPFLGTEEDFKNLCAKAREKGIRIILDGVFNHTGSQSLYFNADGYYPTLGAAQSQDSPYYDWFNFQNWPTKYDSWWGITTLPAVREESQSYVNYIIDDYDSIIRRWLRLGASGWRLDVADELPDWFIEKIRSAMDATTSDAFLLGEVWEDASTKVAYSKRRQYLLGTELHSVMNYPFRTALLDYLKGGDANDFREVMETLRENYPHDAFYSAMNFLGTHDTARILTVLGAHEMPSTKQERAAFRLSPQERARGISLVKLAALILFTFPGSPTVYYGDEAGMEGWEDPLNRACYPWGQEDEELQARFIRLGRLRQTYEPLQQGDIVWLYTLGPVMAYSREWRRNRLVTVVNASDSVQPITLPYPTHLTDLLTGQTYFPQEGHLSLELPPRTGLLLH